MRRALLTVGGTAAGLAALFSFKTHSAVQAAAVAPEPSPLTTSATPGATPSASHSLASPKTAPSATKSAPATKSPTVTPTTSAPAMTRAATPTAAPTTKKPTAPASTAPASTTAPAGKSGTFTGPAENTQYGQVEVQISVSAGKITAARDVIAPEDSIGSNAVGELNSEVVSAQSADVQAVSGATYTSQGYISSLQSAVDQAGL